MTLANRIVSPHPATIDAGPPLRSGVHRLRLPLPLPESGTGWRPFPLIHGGTAGLERFTCHASILTQGETPHLPHTHSEEEVLMVLRGEAELTLTALEGEADSGRRRLRPGEFVYYPAGFPHTLKAVSPEPTQYLMFKWCNEGATNDARLEFVQHETATATCDGSPDANGLRTGRLFDGPTDSLRRFHAHLSTLPPGGGYEPHVDAYDVAIVVLEGEIESLGVKAQASDVLFYVAGEPHGLRNVGSADARYLVFEFDGIGIARPPRPVAPLVVSAGEVDRAKRPKRWKRLLGKLFARRTSES